MSAIDRRDFLKLVGAGTAGAGAGFLVKESSKPRREQYIPYVATPEDYTPGIATWYKTVCTQCGAGCGIEVRVREGRAKKIEGNALHPVSQGNSCALGQSSLNVLYHPDRLRQPQQSRGPRGSGEFNPISWELAYNSVGERLAALRRAGRGDRVALLTGTTRGHLHELLESFMGGLGSDRYLQYDFSAPENLYAANRAAYGRAELPFYDIGNADLLLSFGADYLAHWLSPVAYSRAYGHLRQGAGRARGHVVQIEPRMSLSGANADRWLPARPGSEGLIALAIANRAGAGDDLAAYTAERAARASGIDAAVIEELAERFAAAGRPLALAGGATLNAVNGMANAQAVNRLNEIGGGAVANPEPVFGAGAAARQAGHADMRALIADLRGGRIEMLIVAGTDPVYSLPASLGLREALAEVPLIVAIAPFVDDTSAMADIILAPHSSLETWADDVPQPGVGLATASIVQPVVAPLHDTRPFGDIVIELGRRLGGDMAAVMPWNDTYEFIRARWREFYDARAASLDGMGFDDFWNRVLAAGVWAEERRGPAPTGGARVTDPGEPDRPRGDDEFYFQPYISPALADGRGAALPWQQELPDPLTGVVYNSWVELNPATAAGLKLRDGDVVEIASAAGSLRAPVVTYPAVRPDVVAMPIGQGHEHFGRYASGRGANPLTILDATADRDSGALAWGATMIALRPTGDRVALIRASGTPRDLGRAILGPYGEGGKPDPHDDEHHG